MPKDFSLDHLFQDLGLTILGSIPSRFLLNLFPPEEGKLILEPGCGCGKFGLAYAMMGCEVILLDLDYEAVQYTRRIRGALNSLLGFPVPAQIRVGNIHRIHFADNTFDLVFNEGVSQHWTDEEKRQGSIDQMVRVSRDMVVIMGNNGLREEEQEADRNFDFEYKGMPPRRKCFTPDELEMRLKKAGLKKVNVEGVDPGRIESSYLIAGYGRKH